MNELYTVQYENIEFRWWNPLTWYGNAVYEKETMSPITISVRMKKVFIHADSIGHHLIENCGAWGDHSS